MRIARFANGDDPLFGVITGDVDDNGIPDDDCLITVLAGDPLHVGIEPTNQSLPLSEVRLLAPVIPRSKIVAVGRNYAAHAAEMGTDVPDEPLLFIKPNTTVVGPGDPVFYPRQSQDVHYEGELAVVISRICREVPGPCLANNVEAGRSPVLPASELEAIGYAAVVFPVAATYAVAHALRDLFATIRRTGTTADAQARLTTFDAFNELVGLSPQRRREAMLTDEADRLVAGRPRR